MLQSRIITGLILAVATLFSIYYLSVWYIALIAGVVFILGIVEWSNLMGFEKPTSKAVNSIIFLALAIVVFLGVRSGAITLFSVLYFALVWWMLALVLTFIYPNSKQILSIKFMSFIAGFLTLLPAWMAIIYICDSSVLGKNWLILLLFVIWGSDIGAYFVGKKFGSKKLAENISPGKTWEGLIGGLVASIFIAILAYSFKFIQDISLIKLIILVALTSIFAVIGDLQESIFKRIRGVKDSGNLLPGHGGILDRIDSLTAGAPMFLVFFAMLR